MTVVSVVIGTHNRSELLFERALRSVWAQTHQDLDVIVVGDGTDQATVDRVQGQPIRFWNLPRQKYPEDPGQRWCVLGLEARNFGMDRAVGEFIAPLDDDDEWTPDHVETLLRAIGDAGVAYGRSVAHWAEGGSSFYGQWPPQHFAYCSGAELMRTDLGYRFDPKCVDRGLPEDGDMIDRMVAGGVRFVFVDQIIHHYYPNPR